MEQSQAALLPSSAPLKQGLPWDGPDRWEPETALPVARCVGEGGGELSPHSLPV